MLIKKHKLLLEMEKQFLLEDRTTIIDKFNQIDQLWKDCLLINKNLKTEILDINKTTLELARILNKCSKK